MEKKYQLLLKYFIDGIFTLDDTHPSMYSCYDYYRSCGSTCYKCPFYGNSTCEYVDQNLDRVKEDLSKTHPELLL